MLMGEWKTVNFFLGCKCGTIKLNGFLDTIQQQQPLPSMFMFCKLSTFLCLFRDCTKRAWLLLEKMKIDQIICLEVFLPPCLGFKREHVSISA